MSNINPQNIDGTFPIAGQDNNSQGFRDNFTNTINNFTFTKAELADLQRYAIIGAPLGSVGQTDTTTNNTMNYTAIIKPQLIAAVSAVVSPTVATNAFEVDWSDGHFQEVSISANTTMSFAATWPADYWTKLRLQVVVTGGTYTLQFPATVTVNISNIRGYVSGTTVSLAAGTYQFEFSTYDNGAVVIEDLLRGSRSTAEEYQLYVPTANLQTFTGNVGSTRLIIAPKPSLGASSYQLVTLPNVTADGTKFSISANVATYIGAYSPWVSTTIDSGANVAVAAGSSINFVYNAAGSKWFKV